MVERRKIGEGRALGEAKGLLGQKDLCKYRGDVDGGKLHEQKIPTFFSLQKYTHIFEWQ